jgi:hypothetical protein
MGGSGRPPSPPALRPRSESAASASAGQPPSPPSSGGGVNPPPPRSPEQMARPVVAVVKDLFFVARIRETARLAGVSLTFARTPAELADALRAAPRMVLLDLTGGFDYDAMFATLGDTHPPVLAFTTHALARQTQGWHARCDRVVTKETLTAELPTLLTEGIAP